MNTGQLGAGECWICAFKRHLHDDGDLPITVQFTAEQICEALAEAAGETKDVYVGFNDQDWKEAVGTTTLTFLEKLLKESKS